MAGLASRGRRSLISSHGVATLVCAVLSTSAGCSGQSNFLTGGPTVGQLKTSLSHLEYENEQLKTRTAKLEQENRSMENRLVQEQIDNGDLTARLDDARNLLRDRGIESDVRLGSRRRGEGDEAFGRRRGPSRTDDAGRPRDAPRRKPPFAQISGPVDDVPSVQDARGSAAAREGPRRRTTPSPAGRRRHLDHQSFHTGSTPMASRRGR